MMKRQVAAQQVNVENSGASVSGCQFLLNNRQQLVIAGVGDSFFQIIRIIDIFEHQSDRCIEFSPAQLVGEQCCFKANMPGQSIEGTAG